ncbi:MAG: glycosyltransferase family 39 protein, partial [Planctomycetota bacterium]
MAKNKLRNPEHPSKIKKGKLLSPSAEIPSRRRLLIALVFVLTAIPFVMGKYIEFNSPGAFDSGAYVYSAAHIINGAEIGVQERPSAQLGTLLVNMLGVWLFGFSDIGPKIIQMFMQAGALIILFIAMRKIFSDLSAAVGIIIASTFLSSPLFAKFGNVKEQYMIACMVIGISSFIIYQCDKKWWWALIAGAFLSWGPLFKPTGTTAIGAVGMFVILQPFLKNRTFKQTGIDIALLIAGAAIALAPLYIWIIGWDIRLRLPYYFTFPIIKKWLRMVGISSLASATAETAANTDASGAKQAVGYIARSRKMIPFSELFPRVMRYYSLCLLPISLAVGSILARLIRLLRRFKSPQNLQKRIDDRFVLLLAAWWILDMVFVWISPRSYEQYYLPLNASAAMLGGYIITLYADKFNKSQFKGRWVSVGALALFIMIGMSWNVFFGISKSPFSGGKYPSKQKGYVQKIKESNKRRKKKAFGYWEAVGFYIRQNSTPDDRIYVWGWWPGIYVKAQRFSPISRACMMPRSVPGKFKASINRILSGFEKK